MKMKQIFFLLVAGVLPTMIFFSLRKSHTIDTLKNKIKYQDSIMKVATAIIDTCNTQSDRYQKIYFVLRRKNMSLMRQNDSLRIIIRYLTKNKPMRLSEYGFSRDTADTYWQIEVKEDLH